MPGTRLSDQRLVSPEEIVYREYGGQPPRLSAAAMSAPGLDRQVAWGAAALAAAEALPPLGASWAVLPILSALLVLADFALS